MTYKYKRLPLTSKVVEYILKEKLIFNTKEPILKKEIVNKVLEYHTNNGGLQPNAKIEDVVKKTLSKLKRQGLAIDPQYKYWILKTNATTSENEQTTQVNSASIIEYIYIYYYECYKELANLKTTDVWPCKISIFQNDNVIKNIMPEEVKVETIAVHNAIESEKFLRKLLGETDWINTSPDKVLDIINTVTDYKTLYNQ